MTLLRYLLIWEHSSDRQSISMYEESNAFSKVDILSTLAFTWYIPQCFLWFISSCTYQGTQTSSIFLPLFRWADLYSVSVTLNLCIYDYIINIANYYNCKLFDVC